MATLSTLSQTQSVAAGHVATARQAHVTGALALASERTGARGRHAERDADAPGQRRRGTVGVCRVRRGTDPRGLTGPHGGAAHSWPALRVVGAGTVRGDRGAHRGAAHRLADGCGSFRAAGKYAIAEAAANSKALTIGTSTSLGTDGGLRPLRFPGILCMAPGDV